MSVFTDGKWRSRYPLGIFILISAILFWVMLRYFAMIQANIESISFYNNIEMMKDLFYFQQILAKSGKNQCEVLDRQDLFKERKSGHGLIVLPLNTNRSHFSPKWRYDAKTHELIYQVFGSSYFRSVFGQKIMVHLTCVDGNIDMKFSSHQWCQDMAFWGCRKW